jgi:hypothetical protein
VTLALVFLAGWTLMTVAMMLPSSIPLLGIFSRVARSRSDRPLLVALVVVGYLLAWTAVGAGTYIGALAVRSMAASSPWLSANGWILGAVTLFLGGAYQFSALKSSRSTFTVIFRTLMGTIVPRTCASMQYGTERDMVRRDLVRNEHCGRTGRPGVELVRKHRRDGRETSWPGWPSRCPMLVTAP